MQTRDNLAVIDDGYFYTVGRKWAHGPIDRIERLLTEGKEQGLSHIWILEKSRLSALLGGLGTEYQGWDVLTMPSQDHIGYCSGIRGRDGYDKRIQVGFAEWAPWPWYGANNPKILLATLAYLEDALGVPVEWTPAHVGLDFVKSKNLDRWEWLSQMPIDLEKGTGFKHNQCTGEIHHRGDLLPGKFLIKLDGNSDYGAAMTGLRVGQGSPAWSADGRDYDGVKPGFWRVFLDKGDSLWDGGQLPAFDHREWFTTDLLEQLRKVGYTNIQIDCGWYWKDYHQTLRSSISDKNRPGLWDLRLEWRGRRGQSIAHDNVYESISAILHTIHGRFGSDELGQTRFRRKDILDEVISAAMARKMYRIDKIRRQFGGLLPTKIEIDAAWYAVASPDALDSIIDPNKLGGWKKVYTLEITDSLRADWPTMTTGQLNALAKVPVLA